MTKVMTTHKSTDIHCFEIKTREKTFPVGTGGFLISLLWGTKKNTPQKHSSTTTKTTTKSTVHAAQRYCWT